MNKSAVIDSLLNSDCRCCAEEELLTDSDSDVSDFADADDDKGHHYHHHHRHQRGSPHEQESASRRTIVSSTLSITRSASMASQTDMQLTPSVAGLCSRFAFDPLVPELF